MPLDPRSLLPEGRASNGRHLGRSPEARAQRQDAFILCIRQGMTKAEACAYIEIGIHTPDKWAYQPRDPIFQKRWQEARDFATRKAQENAGVFPEFLDFRQDHFAYLNIRKTEEKGAHPKTGLPWYSRARTSSYVTTAVEHLERDRRLLMVMPPGHLKSTIVGVERTIYDLVKDRNFRTLLVQKNADEASKQVAQVQERLQHDYYHWMADILERQGDEPIECVCCKYEQGTPFKPETRKQDAQGKWGAYGFIINGRTSGEKDYSLQALGVGSMILGIRADRIVLDDVQDQMGAKNPKDSKDKLEWVQGTLLGRITDLQRFAVLANYFELDDFAHKLEESMPHWPVVKFPALDESNRPMAPEFWSVAGLKSKKMEVGERAWEMTWMQNDYAISSATFNRDALYAARDENFRLGDVPYDVTDVFIGVDPAMADTGFCAIVAWGLNIRTKQRYLIDVFNKTGMRNYDNVTDQIAEFARAYQARSVVIEVNNTQRGGLTNQPYFIRQITSTGARYDTYQTVTGLGGRSKQANFDITTVGSLFDAGLITLPYGGTTESREAVDTYIEQLCRWRTDDEGNSIKHLTRDMVMATLFAESEAFKLANRKRERVEQRSDAPPWAKRAWLKSPSKDSTVFTRQQERVSRLMEQVDEQREKALDAAGKD